MVVVVAPSSGGNVLANSSSVCQFLVTEVRRATTGVTSSPAAASVPAPRAEAPSQVGDGVDEIRDSRVLDREVAALAQNHQFGRTRGARQHPGAELNRRPRVPAGVQQCHRRAVALGRGVREP